MVPHEVFLESTGIGHSVCRMVSCHHHRAESRDASTANLQPASLIESWNALGIFIPRTWHSRPWWPGIDSACFSQTGCSLSGGCAKGWPSYLCLCCSCPWGFSSPTSSLSSMANFGPSSWYSRATAQELPLPVSLS